MDRLARRWRLQGMLVLLTVAPTVLAVACGGEGSERETSTGDVISQVEVATRGGDFRGVVDATPGPDGRTTYFTATGPEGPGVFRVPASGGPATAVVTGAPFERPVGIAVSPDGGRLFVTDRGDAGWGAVYRIVGSTPERIAELRAPNLAGLALTRDESTLLVSALSETGTDQVLVIDVATLRSQVFSKTIGENREGGGLHRAHDVDVFAWADFVAGPDRQGRVYTLRR